MTQLRMETNAADVSRFLRNFFHDQLPFATSVAINRTAKDVQEIQRKGMQDRFKIRRKWVLRGIKIRRGDWATKQKPEAIVRVADDRDFLVKFEEGGTKDPRRGNFVPQEVRRTGSGVVSSTMRIGELQFEFWGRGPKAEVWKGDKRTFMILRPNGVGAVFKRKGRRRDPGPIPKRSRRRPRSGENLEFLYLVTPTVDIDPRLKFDRTAEMVVRGRFHEHFEEAFQMAIETAR